MSFLSGLLQRGAAEHFHFDVTVHALEHLPLGRHTDALQVCAPHV